MTVVLYGANLLNSRRVPIKLTSVAAHRYLRDSGVFPSTLSLESPRGQDYRNTVSSRRQNIKSIFSQLGIAHISVWKALHL
jgi:hypothetical protein